MVNLRSGLADVFIPKSFQLDACGNKRRSCKATSAAHFCPSKRTFH